MTEIQLGHVNNWLHTLGIRSCNSLCLEMSFLRINVILYKKFF